jgi:cytoskeletal protein CcmA (bactofilin family)
MNIRRIVATSLTAGVLVAGFATGASADDVTRTGTYTVRAGQTIDGDLKVSSGTVTILGTVKGNVTQTGTGAVIVGSSGTVEGNVAESGSGGVRVAGTVEGNVSEKATGNVVLPLGGHVDGNIAERDAGNLTIASSLNGNAYEYGSGYLLLGKNARVDGNVYERDNGNLYLYRGAQIEGDISEGGSGSRIRR